VADAQGGKLDVVLVHDFGQLGKTKVEIFRHMAALRSGRTELYILGVGKVTDQTKVPPASQIDAV